MLRRVDVNTISRQTAIHTKVPPARGAEDFMQARKYKASKVVSVAKLHR